MTYTKTRIAAITSALLTLPAPGSAEDITIVASFSILGDMIEQVAGDLGNVVTIVGTDADAHIYQPSVSDARVVADADVIFVNGLGFETWSETLIAESGTDAEVFVATEGVIPLRVEGKIDPHAWNALPNGVIYVENIAKALTTALPAHSEEFATNARIYIAELESLDREARAAFAALPQDRRTVVTAHDAFGYLATSYGLNFLSPVGIDTEAEPSARDLATLIRQLKDENVAGLFVENISNPALIEQIAEETGLEIGGRLFSDALSARGGPATSYLAMFRHNLSVLLDTLNEK